MSWPARIWLACLALSCSCASTPYAFAPHGETDLTLRLREGEPQFERGRPHALVDGLGHWFFSLPSKLLLLDWRVNDHDVTPEVEEALRAYLHANGLCNTKVRVNEYAPGGEWQRLFRNREMPGGWRYTIGVLSVSFYTIFPDRLFAGLPLIGGGDQYNPYTNTISLYSGRRPIALHEGGHAKDLASKGNRHWKGLYAGARSIPLVGLLVALVQESVATSDALSWELATGDDAASKRAYRSLYPAYGTYLGGAASNGASFFIGGWILYAVQYGIVVAGHVAGQTRALFVADRPEGLQPELVSGSPAGPLEDAVPGAAPAGVPPPCGAALAPGPAGSDLGEEAPGDREDDDPHDQGEGQGQGDAVEGRQAVLHDPRDQRRDGHGQEIRHASTLRMMAEAP